MQIAWLQAQALDALNVSMVINWLVMFVHNVYHPNQMYYFYFYIFKYVCRLNVGSSNNDSSTNNTNNTNGTTPSVKSASLIGLALIILII